MGPVLPVHPLVVDQAHICLVDQRGGLQAMADALAFHVAACEAAKLVVHDRRQLRERALVTAAPRTEERTNVIPDRFSSAPAFWHCAGRQIISAFTFSLPDS